MRLYDCKVLLAGSRDNEVRKTDVTAAEIMALRDVHGPDSVIDIEKKGMDKRSHGEERARIYALYADAEALDNKAKVDRLNAIFGPSHNPLPVELPDEPGIDLDAAPVVRAKVAPKAGRAEDIAAAAALT
jgi:hypothetical protein